MSTRISSEEEELDGECYFFLDDNVPVEDVVLYGELCNEGKHKEAKERFPEMCAHVEHCGYCTSLLANLSRDVTIDDYDDLYKQMGL